MTTVSTPLSHIFPFVRTPVVVAPMAGAGGGALIGAAASAGALAFIGAGYYTTEELQKQLALACAKAPRLDGRLPFGVGLLVWRLGVPGDVHTALVDALVDARTSAVWLSFGEREPTAEWIKYIRARDSEIRIVTTVNTVEDARVAAEEWNVDVIGIQGIEAGGHGLGSAPPRDALLSSVINEASNWKRNVPVIAAGGIADGRGVAAVLVQGAAGAALGTRFLVTPESLYTDAQKALLVGAGPGDTLRSMAFDDARGTTNWPAGIDGRGLMSPTVAEYEDAAARGAIETEAEQRRSRYSASVAAGQTERMITWSGTGVGSITSVVPAGDLVSSITAEAARLLVAGAQLVHKG